MADLIGKDIGRYHIIEQVGEGGMATVFKAFDTRLERDVAIKVIRTRAIPPDQLDKLLKRFEREAKRMAKFTHLNIVPIIDYGEYENAPYLVMPYLQGGTLKNLLAARAGKPMSVQESAAILAPVARALEYAHEQETIHRDVKPANILLTTKGQPMLTDFGVAKILDLDEGQTLTGTGVGVGTPKYMAPEQWENQVLPQTDVYGLGVVLYEMLTGKVPYDAETPAGVHKKLLTEALLRPRTLNPSISEEAERVIYKAMAKDPLQRYADMGAFAQALEKLGQAALSPALHPQAGVGNETTIDYGSAAQPYSKDEPYRTVSFLETSSAEPQSTWIGKRSDPPQTKPQPPKLMVEQEKKPSGIAGWVWGVFVIAAVVIGVLVLLLANTATHPPATEAPQQTAPIQESPTEVPQQTAPIQESPTEASTKTAPKQEPPTEAAKQEPSSGETRISQKDGMEMIYIPPGEFMMGSTDSDSDAQSDEKPQHKVDLDGYWMDKSEVTNAMYQKCVSDGSCKEPQSKVSATHNDYYGNGTYANYPVINVDWNQSQAYCQWAGGSLPSEAQWEKAARGTDGRTYPWGDGSPDNSLLNYNNNLKDTTAVGSYPSGASAYGLLDMSGNVWEWVNDWYAADYYANSAQKNPTGADSGQYRVLRGGPWNNETRDVRAANRNRLNPDLRSFNLGFRCVR